MRNIHVSGTATETANQKFNFYVFTKPNYELWKAGRPYEAYLEVKGDDNYSFSFSPTYEDINNLYFVVENENCVVRIKAVAEWIQKWFLSGPTNRPAGIFLCVMGVVLVIIAIAIRKPTPKEVSSSTR